MNDNKIGTNENGYSFPEEILTRIKALNNKINDFEKYPDLWQHFKIKFINMSMKQEFILFQSGAAWDVVTSFSTFNNIVFASDELAHCERIIDQFIEENKK